jgi:hypothetical protein
MDDSEDVFLINATEAEETVAEAPVGHTEELARETEADTVDRVKGLVPLCTQHAQGPQLSSATFGYDIAQMAKRPWAEPGAKLSDYFNYGFNEQSWRVYCAMQKNGEDSLLAKATEMLQKLEATGRPSAVTRAVGAAEGGAADPSAGGMMMMEGYGAAPYGVGGGGGYGGDMGMYRGGGGGGYNVNNNSGRPYDPRDFHQGGMGGGDPRGHNANYKTRLCKSFAEGHCHRGESCNYAHGVAELRQPGGGAGGPPTPQQQQQQQQPMQPGPGYGGAAAFYAGGAAPPPPPPPERTANYLMPPFQPGGALPPMMQPNTLVPPPQQQPMDGEGASGFRQPPKRQRHEGGGVYEPQY